LSYAGPARISRTKQYTAGIVIFKRPSPEKPPACQSVAGRAGRLRAPPIQPPDPAGRLRDPYIWPPDLSGGFCGRLTRPGRRRILMACPESYGLRASGGWHETGLWDMVSVALPRDPIPDSHSLHAAEVRLLALGSEPGACGARTLRTGWREGRTSWSRTSWSRR